MSKEEINKISSMKMNIIRWKHNKERKKSYELTHTLVFFACINSAIMNKKNQKKIKCIEERIVSTNEK